MMKKLVTVLLFLSLVIGISTSALANSNEKSSKKEFEEILDEFNMDDLDVNDFGNYYYDKDMNLVFQIKKDSFNTKNKLNLEENKLSKVQKRLNEKFSKQTKTEYVDYSLNDLIKLQDEIMLYFRNKNINQYELQLDVKKNNLNLIIGDVDSKVIDFLSKYDQVLEVQINSEFNLDISKIDERIAIRDRDFNKLGAGIGIQNGFGEGCTMAGLATKDTRTFIITAGHCLTTATMSQMYSSVGRTHLDARASGFDFGLIEVTGTSLKRYATNGLLVSNLIDYNYDSSLQSSGAVRYGEKLCRVGLTTHRSCGLVTLTRNALNGNVIFEVTESTGADISEGGDSGGPWYTSETPHRLVGIHKGSGESYGLPEVGYVTPWIEVRDKYGLSLYTSSAITPLN